MSLLIFDLLNTKSVIRVIVLGHVKNTRPCSTFIKCLQSVQVFHESFCCCSSDAVFGGDLNSKIATFLFLCGRQRME